MSRRAYAERAALADRVRHLREQTAVAVTEEFLRRHPDWLERYGERARRFGIEDAAFHVDFLAGALESGDPTAFGDYVRWTGRVLQGRGIAPRFLAENLEQVHAALLPHLSEPEAAVVAEFVAVGLEACGPAPAPADEGDEGDLALTFRLYVQAIVRGERRAALGVVEEALRTGATVEQLYLQVLQRSLYEIGRRWETNQLSVAQEHMATAVTQYVMGRLYERIEPAGSARGTAIVTGVQGELHQVGGNMVADMLEADGWSVQFLGTNMPHVGIVQAVREQQPQVVGISATMLFNLPHVRSLIEAIRREALPEPPRILVGGAAFRSAPELWSEIGADGFAPNLREAVELARQYGKIRAS